MTAEPSAGVVELVNGILRRAIDAGATDVHFEPADDGLHVRFRIQAMLEAREVIPAPIAANVVARLKVLAGLLTYRTDVPQEGSIQPTSAPVPCDVRVATFPTIRGERVVLRILSNAQRLRTLDELGHDPSLVARLHGLLGRPQGLIAVCGPAGSGKTTTLFALLDALLRLRPGVSIISIEDPVEIRLEGVTQVALAPLRGLTYPVALRSLLRQDPQVLMIGEVRDAEVADIVIEAALTGHLLLTTLHSGSAPEAIVRLLEMGVPPYQITSTLVGVLAQRLVRTTAASGDALSERSALGHLVEMSPPLRQAILAGGDAVALAAACAGSLHADARRLLDAGRTTQAEIDRVLGRAHSGD